MSGIGASHAWELAKERRDREEECHEALEVAREATRALDKHLDAIATIEAPAKPPATTVSREWYESYRRLSRARDAAFRTFDRCLERETSQKV